MAKLALEADANIVGESFIVQPDRNLAGKLGALFGIIEIYNANGVFIDGFLSAMADLKTEYYLPPLNLERGVEKRLEEAIGRANRRIAAAINQSIEEIDLRNVSAIIGLLHDGKIYLSSAGRAKGLFYRRKKNLELLIIDILSGNGEARFRPEAEKIFANILSGELTERDALLIINEEFLGVFSQKNLGEIVLDNSPTEAVRILDEALREKVAKKNFYAVVVSGADQSEATAIHPDAEEPAVSAKPFRDPPIGGRGKADNNALAEPAARNLMPARNATPANNASRSDANRHNVAGGPTQQSIDRLLITQVRTEKYLTPSLLPQWQKILLVAFTLAKKYSLWTWRRLKKSWQATARIIADKIKKQSAIAGQGESAPETMEETILPQSPTDATEEIATEKIAPAPKKNAGKLSGEINYFLNAQIEKFLSLKRSQRIILILALILLYLFSQSIVMIGRATGAPENGSSANSVIAKQITDRLNSAEAQNIFNDEAGAVQSIKQARELLAQIPGTWLNKSFRADLQSKIDAAAKALQKINYLAEPTVVADFSADRPTGLIGLAKTGNVFWAFDNADKTLYRLDSAIGKLTSATTSLPDAKKIAAIDDKNLILSVDGKTFYKYDIAKRAVSKIKPAKDYFQIKLPTAASPLIDPSLASSTIAMSVASEAYSFYLDGAGGRVVCLDKNGVLKRQFYSDAFKGAESLAASYKEKKLFVFNADKIYQVDLDF